MARLRLLVGVLGVVTVTTVCLNVCTEQRNAAFADDQTADLLQRIETLEGRVTMLERQLARTTRSLSQPAMQSLVVPKYWSKREFNGAPVYIVPLGETKPKN